MGEWTDMIRESETIKETHFKLIGMFILTLIFILYKQSM